MSANLCSNCGELLNTDTPLPLDKPHLCDKCQAERSLKERAPEILRVLKDVLVDMRSYPGIPRNSFFRAIQVIKRADPDAILVETGRGVWEWRWRLRE